MKVNTNKFVHYQVTELSVLRRSKIRGVGVNDANYLTQYTSESGQKLVCPYYRKWKNMLDRCYSSQMQEYRPNYVDCTVSDNWLLFSNFRKWMIEQDWEGNVLDKDILFEGNHVYSEGTCVFIDHHTNTLLGDSATTRGKYPQGVCWHKQREKFQAYIRIDGKRRSLGLYHTVGEADMKYSLAKADEISRIAQLQPDQRVADALDARAEELRLRYR